MPRPMRKQFDNNLTGVLFDNERKEGDAHPDMKGSTEVDGIEYWVSAWWNKHAHRGDYLKLKLTPKESDDRSPQQRNNQRVDEHQSQRGPQHGGNRGGNYGGNQSRGRQQNNDNMDDDIPFN